MDQADQRAHRPLAFEKMEGLVQEMQQAGTGISVRSQKQFLTSIPYAFTGYDVIEWLMVRLDLDDPVEAISIANQLCHYGYFFPVSDSKNLIVKDDGSLYRFQIPYYWPCQHRNPDNVEYAIYLVKRSLRNKQRHGLDEHEQEALNSLKRSLANKWDFITVQAEEQVKLAKERKKVDKIVADSQEKAYWRIHRPPPGYASSLELLPPRGSSCISYRKRRSSTELRKEVEFLRENINRSRLKASVALENLIQCSETYVEYDPFLTPLQPSNPWLTDDGTFWQLNNSIVEMPTEKRVKRWALSMEDLVADPTGLQEFTNYLRKEYSHENIRFWMAAKDLRTSSQLQIPKKVQEIYEEFLAAGAPCEVNIDGKTMEKTQLEMKNPSRFTFDSAAEHVYTLLLKKDCYPRFIRSEHYKNLLTSAVQPTGKKKFDFFGFQGKLKNPGQVSKSGGILPMTTQGGHTIQTAGSSNFGSSILHKRRGSDRSLTGSTHELMVNARVAHSHSQSNITEIPYRGDIPFLRPHFDYEQEPTGGYSSDDVTEKSVGDDVCPWDAPEFGYEKHRLHLSPSPQSTITEEHFDHHQISAAPPGTSSSRKNSNFLNSSSSSDVSLPERLKKSCNLHDTFSRFSRRSSSTMNSKQQPDSNRPSVSSTEDLAPPLSRSFDSNPPSLEREPSIQQDDPPPPPPPVLQSTSTRRRSLSSFMGRKQSTSATPLISVSSVTEQSDSEEAATNVTMEDDEEEAVAANPTMEKEDPCRVSSSRQKHDDDNDGGDRKPEDETASTNVTVPAASVSSSVTTTISFVKERTKGRVIERTTTIRSPSKRSSSNATDDIVIKESIVQRADSTSSSKDPKKPDKPASPNEVCPWEDEESCKVKSSSYMKFYETLGYL